MTTGFAKLLPYTSAGSAFGPQRAGQLAALILIALFCFLTDGHAQSTGQDVRIRSGAHADYTRLVFDFTRRTGYTVRRDGGLVTLTFNTPANLVTGPINRQPPLFIGGVRAAAGGAQTVAVVAVPANARVRDLTVGTKVVLDVFEPPVWQDPVLPVQCR